MLALLMHDLGWATTKELLSKDKRFEVDGAELAVKFVQDHIHEVSGGEKEWDKQRLEDLWTAIALHTSPTIVSHHPNPLHGLVGLSIVADFFGPNLPPPLGKGIITVDEYKAIVKAFPREHFKDNLIEVFCGLCREKEETTFDNFASAFGQKFGLDGKGAGREEFVKKCEERNFADWFMAGLDGCAEIEKEMGYVDM